MLKIYLVTTPTTTYSMRAKSLAHCAAFVRHWQSVRIERIVYAFNERPQWHKNLPVKERIAFHVRDYVSAVEYTVWAGFYEHQRRSSVEQ